jgi:general stress protein 26
MDKCVFQTETGKKAAKLLEQCESVYLVSITEKGYPRICEMEKVKTDGYFEIYMTTRVASNKVKHFLINEKAGVYYAAGDDRVSLVGDMEIIEDEAVKKEIWKGKHERRFVKDEKGKALYCILKFTAVEALFFFDGQNSTVSINNKYDELFGVRR